MGHKGLTMLIPPIIQQLAARAGGGPIAWKEYANRIVIVFDTGHKLTFEKAATIDSAALPKKLAATKPRK